MILNVRRVPVPIVILLSACAIGLPWYYGTRHLDFMTPPSDEELSEIRRETRESVPGRARLFSAQPSFPRENPAPPPPPPPPPLAIEPGNLEEAPVLDLYRSHAEKGAPAFLELAAHLEQQGHPAQALLAWERVLDSGSPDENQLRDALAAIGRLRASQPDWNADPLQRTSVRLEITAPSARLTPAFRQSVTAVAKDLSSLTSGLVEFLPHFEPTPRRDRSKGFSLRLAGATPNASATGTFQVDQWPESTAVFNFHLYSGSFKLIAAHLAERDDLNPPSIPPADEDLRQAFQTRITRLAWSIFAKSLHSP